MFSCLPHSSSRALLRRRARAAEGPRPCFADGAGFTIIEVLVVILIVGTLAAIAIPVFFGQQQKAVDAQAQELARTAETTAETIGVDDGGEYGNVTVGEVHRHEPTIPIAPGGAQAYLNTTTRGAAEYSLTVRAANGDEFTIARDTTGTVTRECLSPVIKVGCSGKERGSW